jgi:hypothetical protein
MVRIAQHHRDRFPPAQFLNRLDIDPGLAESRGKGMPEIMEPESRDARLPHRRIECPQQIACIPWVARSIEKDRLRVAGPHGGASLEHCHRRLIDRQRIPRAVFLLQDRERAACQIQVGPVQLQDLSASHARMECKHDDLLRPRRGGREQPLLLLWRQPPLDQIADLLLVDLLHGIVGGLLPLPHAKRVGVT